MVQTVSKSQFKPHALEYFRKVQETGEELVLTDHGKPVLKISPYQPGPEAKAAGARRLRGAVARYDAPFEPVGLEDWEALK